MRTFLALFAASVALLIARPAEACSYACSRDKVAPRGSQPIPANSPAIALILGGPDRDDAGFVVRRSDGGLVATTVDTDELGRTLLRFGTSLEPDQTYDVTFSSPTCFANTDGGFARLRTTDVAPLPTTPASLSIRKTGHGTVTVESDGPCVEDIHAAFAQLSIAVPDELRPFLPITRWELDVTKSGASFPVLWADNFYGALSGDGGIYAASEQLRHDVVLVYGTCEAPRAGVDDGLALGTYEARLTAVVAGTNQDLVSQPVSFTLSCAGPRSSIESYRLSTDELLLPPPDANGGDRLDEGAPCGCGASNIAAAPFAAFALGYVAWRGRRRSEKE